MFQFCQKYKAVIVIAVFLLAISFYLAVEYNASYAIKRIFPSDYHMLECRLSVAHKASIVKELNLDSNEYYRINELFETTVVTKCLFNRSASGPYVKPTVTLVFHLNNDKHNYLFATITDEGFTALRAFPDKRGSQTIYELVNKEDNSLYETLYSLFD